MGADRRVLAPPPPTAGTRSLPSGTMHLHAVAARAAPVSRRHAHLAPQASCCWSCAWSWRRRCCRPALLCSWSGGPRTQQKQAHGVGGVAHAWEGSRHSYPSSWAPGVCVCCPRPSATTIDECPCCLLLSPAIFVCPLIPCRCRERASGSKAVQRVAGVRASAFWAANLLFDLALFSVSAFPASHVASSVPPQSRG